MHSDVCGEVAGTAGDLRRKYCAQDGGFKASKDEFRNTTPTYTTAESCTPQQRNFSWEILSDHHNVNNLWVAVRLERMINESRRLVQYSTQKSFKSQGPEIRIVRSWLNLE